MTAVTASMTAGQEWRAYWPLVLSATVGMSLTVVHLYSMGVFLDPIQQELGWSRTAITFGQTLSSLIGAVFSPFFGMLIDRYGSRRLALPGAALYCLAFSSLSLTTGSLVLWYAQWTLFAIGFLAIKPTTWCSAISRSFTASRGLALAVTLCGVGFSAAIIPLLANTLISTSGWRTAFFALGAGWAVAVLGLCYFFFYEPADVRASGRVESTAPVAGLPGVSFRKGLGSAAFIKLAMAGFLFSIAMLAMTFHFVPLLSERGVDRGTAAAVAGLIGISAIVGRLITGYLIDRLSAVWVGSVAMCLPVVAISVLLGLDGSIAMALAAAALLGFSSGAELDVLTYLVGKHFGLKHFGALYGSIISVLALSTALGPLSASAIRDLMGSYDAVLWTALPLFLCSALAIATIGAPPEFDSEPKPV